MNKNVPNILTVLRAVLVPFFVFFYLSRSVSQPLGRYIALAIFAAASFTDFLDGYLARKYQLISNFGKFMDPLADKLLVMSACICFVQTGKLSAWVVCVLMGREFIISGFRLMAATHDRIMSAGIWGKLKTNVQMFMVIALLLDFQIPWFQLLEQLLIYASVALSLISLFSYLKGNLDVLEG